MTVVNPKSISGINSITTGNGSDNLLTIHTSDASNTERVRINSSGDVIVGSGITVSPDGDIFATGITTISENLKVGTGVTISPDGDAFFTGVCTATSFSGDGSALTGLSGVSVANQSDNRVITNTGTTDALNAEANLTFDGSDLTITNSGASNKGLKMTATGNYYPSIVFDANRGAENNAIVYIRGNWNGTEVGALSVEAGDDTTNKDDGKVTFYTAQGGTMTRKMAIEQDGNVHVDTGNLSFGTAGKGIDFGNASGSASGSSSALLDDYEEGTWTPTLYYSGSGSATLSEALGNYTKVGRLVHVMITLTCSAQGSGSGNAYIGNFPFTSGSTSGFRINGNLTYITGFSNLNSQLNIYFGGSGTYVHIFHMNSINPTSAIENITRSNIGDSTTIRGHATYYVD